MKQIKSFAPVLGVMAVASAAFLMPELAMADTIGETAKRVSGNLQEMKNLAVNVGFFIGLVLAITGLWLFYKDSTQPGQGHAKKGFIALVIGVLLLSLPWVIDTTSSTITNDGGSSQDRMKEQF